MCFSIDSINRANLIYNTVISLAAIAGLILIVRNESKRQKEKALNAEASENLTVNISGFISVGSFAVILLFVFDLVVGAYI